MTSYLWILKSILSIGNSLVARISACHAGDRGSIPRCRDFFGSSKSPLVQKLETRQTRTFISNLKSMEQTRLALRMPSLLVNLFVRIGSNEAEPSCGYFGLSLLSWGSTPDLPRARFVRPSFTLVCSQKVNREDHTDMFIQRQRRLPGGRGSEPEGYAPTTSEKCPTEKERQKEGSSIIMLCWCYNRDTK
jgi:hypothetical protein